MIHFTLIFAIDLEIKNLIKIQYFKFKIRHSFCIQFKLLSKNYA